MRLLTFVVLLASACGWAGEQPKTTAWGPYAMRLEDYHSEDGLGGQRLLLIKDGEETVLADGVRVRYSLAEVTGEGLPELLVTGYSGGAHCCFSEYVFSLQNGRVVTLSAGDWGNGGLLAARDQNGDGQDELTFVYVYGYLGGLCYACSPALWRTFEWRGGLFVDATRRFPDITRKHMEEARKALLRETEGDGRRHWAAEYWINAYALGQGDGAWAWLQTHTEPELRDWLRQQRIVLLRPFSALP